MQTIMVWLLNYKLLTTYSLEHSPFWEANQFSVSQEIPHILLNLKVHYHIPQVAATCPHPEPDWSSKLQITMQ